MGRLAGDPLKVSVTIMAEGVVAVECNRCGALVDRKSVV